MNLDDDEDTNKKYSKNKRLIKGNIDNISVSDIIYYRAMIELRKDISNIYKDNQDVVLDEEDNITVKDNIESEKGMPFDQYLKRLQISSSNLKDGYYGIVGNNFDLEIMSILFNINIDLIKVNDDGSIDEYEISAEDAREMYTHQNHVYNKDKPVRNVKIAELLDGYYVSLK